MSFQPKTELPEGMKLINSKKLDPYACFRLVGAVIWHSIAIAPGASNPNTTSYYMKKKQVVQVRALRARFGKENPLIGMWCSLAGYDEGKVRKAIIIANQ